MASYFDEIAGNRLKSVALMLLFGLLFVGIIAFFDIFLTGSLDIGVLAIGAVFIAIYAAFSYFIGSALVLRMSGAKEADREKYPDLYDVVDGLSRAAQVPMPKVYIQNDPNPNAFATGRNRKASSITVTSGLLSMMNKNELTGVVSHEMSHIADNDIQFMMLAVVFAGIIGIIAALVRNWIFFGFGFGGGNNRGNMGAILLIGIVIGILAPIFALLIRLAISRRREYMADANGARIIRDPQSLAGALTKIRNYTANPSTPPMRNANEVTSMLYFSSPFKKGNIMNLFSTHPPIDERIKRLEAMY